MRLFFFEGDKKKWNNFLIENNGSFLQNFEWGEFQKKISKRVWQFEVKEKNKTVAVFQIIKESFPFGKSYLYIPFGPCFGSSLFLKGKKEALNLILMELKKIAKKENAIFLRIEPVSPLPKISAEVNSQKRVQPQKTLILNLAKEEDKIFSGFHQKTRYNIRLSRKKGIKVISRQPPAASRQSCFDGFYKLIQKTAERDNFKPYSKEYYKKMLEIPFAKLFLAVFENKIVAGNIVMFFGKRAVYLHGASDYNFRRLMAPHLLQWEQICEAKKRGCGEYDFWGIDDSKWPGVTRFKNGFGGETIKYSKGKDFIFSNFWHKAYILSRKKFIFERKH